MDPGTPELLPISRAAALRHGMTRRELDALVASGRLTRLARGVYVATVGPDDLTRYLQRVAAALLTKTNHVAVADSAIAIHGLPNPWFMPWSRRPIRIAGPKSRPDRGIAARGADAPALSPWGPVTDLARTAAAAAAALPVPQALMVTDAAARRLAGTRDRVVLASEACRTRVRNLLLEVDDHPALRLADPAAESPAESFYRGQILIRAEFPQFRVGVPRRGASGRRYFADLLAGQLVVEIDGAVKYTGREVLLAEKAREDDLRAAGHDFLRAYADRVFADPAAEMRRLADKLASRR